MTFNKCYFISWLGDFREERLALLYEAVQWAKSHNFQVHIIAMMWKAEDYKKFRNVVFVKIPAKLPPAQARNVALSMFYATNDNLCMILDDDTYIAEGDSLINLLRQRYVDGILYTVRDSTRPIEDCKGKHRFERPNQINSGVFIVRQEANLYFNTEFKYYKGKLLWGEDVNFLGRVYDKGERAYEIVTARTNKSRERDVTPSTWHLDETFLQTDMHLIVNRRDFSNRVVYKNGHMLCKDPTPIPFEL